MQELSPEFIRALQLLDFWLKILVPFLLVYGIRKPLADYITLWWAYRKMRNSDEKFYIRDTSIWMGDQWWFIIRMTMDGVLFERDATEEEANKLHCEKIYEHVPLLTYRSMSKVFAGKPCNGKKYKLGLGTKHDGE